MKNADAKYRSCKAALHKWWDNRPWWDDTPSIKERLEKTTRVRCERVLKYKRSWKAAKEAHVRARIAAAVEKACSLHEARDAALDKLRKQHAEDEKERVLAMMH
jgi:hypothetical protein